MFRNLIVGNTNPIAAEYETVTDENGFLISRRIVKESYDYTRIRRKE